MGLSELYDGRCVNKKNLPLLRRRSRQTATTATRSALRTHPEDCRRQARGGQSVQQVFLGGVTRLKFSVRRVDLHVMFNM
jgi:hypothetical protein